MRINSSIPAPNLENLPIDDQIDTELMSTELEQSRVDGEGMVRLIETTNVGVNMPLREGPIGRRINIRI